MSKRSDAEVQWEALDRMKRAFDRGTGCHLTAAHIQALSVSPLGEVWSTPKGPIEDQARGH